MKKAMTALIVLMSSTGALAAEPETTMSLVASCCAAISACCGVGLSCCG